MTKNSVKSFGKCCLFVDTTVIRLHFSRRGIRKQLLGEGIFPFRTSGVEKGFSFSSVPKAFCLQLVIADTKRSLDDGALIVVGCDVLG